ncbi:MAG TPA: TraR/DksA C4-type zinc finger protein [Pilimelia sp.]|nr:TraR/DksA C4-type zinc finger protein [Pilimelia sp.]
MLVDDTRATPMRGGATRSQTEIDEIRLGLQQRYEELQSEYEQAVTETQLLSRSHLADTAGDDDADIGTKTSEREREMSVIRSISDRREQVENAIARLAAGAYGWCERCSGPIPVERLAVFPWATSCVGCKQLAERRAG